ncbi:oxidoreductase [Maritimibacter sp. 55A14]|uniref:DUF934 domain-containing protein n=1 Tax=Maritimibacter sp. 55A14 TaxID=2174844 RepID=UPI000D609101|nr:DUF934 domain-containing protein [Maritimibacter sp. 55A14]PWE28844.1 oxidoreductase [Maritimibacter sp. 55A14]
MCVIVTDTGFAPEDWTHGFLPLEAWDAGEGRDLPALALSLPPDMDADLLSGLVTVPDLIRIFFPSFADGRGFTLGRRLRDLGFQGRMRAAGHVLADQYAMARRAGFDEVEISDELAARQPEDHWLFRAKWRAGDYQSRLRGVAHASA